MPVTVALVSPLAPPPGGIATWTAGLLRQAAGDAEVEIVHFNSAVRLRTVGSLSFWRRACAGLVYSSELLVALLVTLVTKPVDVVHVCSSGSLGLIRDLMLRAMTWAFMVPLVIHFRFGRLPHLAVSRNWEALLVRMVCAGGAHALVLDENSAVALRSIAPGCKVDVIPNPAWDLATVPSGECCEEPVLVFAGHVIQAKGARELVLACREIRTRPFRLELVGPVEEDFRKELKALAEVRDGGRWLEVVGTALSAEVTRRIARGYAVILPSYTEGFPNVVLEAMVQSKPVVATDVGANPEMLAVGSPEPCGICVSIMDADALRVAIEWMLDRPTQAAEFGRRGRERVVLLYSPNRIYGTYRALWVKCKKERGRRGTPQMGQRPMKVLLVAPVTPPAGGIASWAEGLLSYPPQDPAIEFVHVNTAIRLRASVNTSTPARVLFGSLDSARVLVRFTSALWSSKAGVVHICSSGSFGLLRDVMIIGMSRLRGARAVVHLHFGRMPLVAASTNWETALVMLACKLASHTITLDTPSAEVVRGFVGDCSVSVVPNPAWKIAEPHVTSTESGAERSVIFVGNVTPAKGMFELLNACCQIRDIAFDLDLVGPVTARFREELVGLARARQGGCWLRIHGAVSRGEVLALMARSSAFVLPSHTEGFPVSILEAMTLGTPVIATAVGAVPDMLLGSTEERCGICVQAGNVEALRVAIRQLLEQPSFARELALRAKARVVNKYSPEIVYPMYQSIWNGGEVQSQAADDPAKTTVRAGGSVS